MILQIVSQIIIQMASYLVNVMSLIPTTSTSIQFVSFSTSPGSNSLALGDADRVFDKSTQKIYRSKLLEMQIECLEKSTCALPGRLLARRLFFSRRGKPSSSRIFSPVSSTCATPFIGRIITLTSVPTNNF